MKIPDYATIVTMDGGNIGPSTIGHNIVSHVYQYRGSSTFRDSRYKGPRVFTFSHRLNCGQLVTYFRYNEPFNGEGQLSHIRHHGASTCCYDHYHGNGYTTCCFFGLDFGRDGGSYTFQQRLSLVLIYGRHFITVLQVFDLDEGGLLSGFDLPFSFFLFQRGSGHQGWWSTTTPRDASGGRRTTLNRQGVYHGVLWSGWQWQWSTGCVTCGF